MLNQLGYEIEKFGESAITIRSIPKIFSKNDPVNYLNDLIVQIEEEKYPVQMFVDFIEKINPSNNKIEIDQVENLLSAFIGEKLIEKEVEYFDVNLSDDSLSKLIKILGGHKTTLKFFKLFCLFVNLLILLAILNEPKSPNIFQLPTKYFNLFVMNKNLIYRVSKYITIK